METIANIICTVPFYSSEQRKKKSMIQINTAITQEKDVKFPYRNLLAVVYYLLVFCNIPYRYVGYKCIIITTIIIYVYI